MKRLSTVPNHANRTTNLPAENPQCRRKTTTVKIPPGGILAVDVQPEFRKGKNRYGILLMIPEGISEARVRILPPELSANPSDEAPDSPPAAAGEQLPMIYAVHVEPLESSPLQP